MSIDNLKFNISYQLLCNYREFAVIAGFVNNKFLRVFTANEETGEVY